MQVLGRLPKSKTDVIQVNICFESGNGVRANNDHVSNDYFGYQASGFSPNKNWCAGCRSPRTTASKRGGEHI
jgi:hypothetical protein